MKKSQKVKNLSRSSLNFSKVYFSKPTSVILVSAYVTVLVVLVATFGLSKLIKSPENTAIPELPESEAFAFLPADNDNNADPTDIDIPVLGDVKEKPEKTEEGQPEETPSVQAPHPASNIYNAPASNTSNTSNTPSTPAQTTQPQTETKAETNTTTTILYHQKPQTTQNQVPDETYSDNFDAPGDIPYESSQVDNAYLDFEDLEKAPVVDDEPELSETEED